MINFNSWTNQYITQYKTKKVLIRFPDKHFDSENIQMLASEFTEILVISLYFINSMLDLIKFERSSPLSMF